MNFIKNQNLFQKNKSFSAYTIISTSLVVFLKPITATSAYLFTYLFFGLGENLSRCFISINIVACKILVVCVILRFFVQVFSRYLFLSGHSLQTNVDFCLLQYFVCCCFSFVVIFHFFFHNISLFFLNLTLFHFHRTKLLLHWLKQVNKFFNLFLCFYSLLFPPFFLKSFDIS